jgi:hypothetical protein
MHRNVFWDVTLRVLVRMTDVSEEPDGEEKK